MIYVTRHGETNWNLEQKVMGRVDIPLNQNGRKQATIVRDSLFDTSIDKIICSPLLRAKQTADIINQRKQVEIIYDNRLIERDFGEFEGMNTKDFDFDGFWDYYQNEHYKKAENIQDFFDRVYEAVDDIMMTYQEETILIVAHGGISIPIDCYFRKSIPTGSLLHQNIVLGNCQVKAYQKKSDKLYNS